MLSDAYSDERPSCGSRYNIKKYHKTTAEITKIVSWTIGFSILRAILTIQYPATAAIVK